MEPLNLQTLHLEDAIVLPDNYLEIITDRRELTPEMKEQGFRDGVWGKDRRYNFIYLWSGIKPFTVRVIEPDLNSTKFSIQYQLEFHVEQPEFAPFVKFIKEWAKQNRKKGKLNERFTLWLLEQLDLPKETDDSLICQIPVNNDQVTFKLESEKDFYIVLKELSRAFRTLATEHAADPVDMAAEFEYDDSELRGMGYWDMANNVLTPMVLRGLIEGLAAYRTELEGGKTSDRHISIEVKKRPKTMLFFHGDSCKGEPFHTFEIGSVLSKCLTGIRDNGLEYDAELSHWFTDAAHNLPEKAVEGLRICIEVPETGGDPVFEN